MNETAYKPRLTWKEIEPGVWAPVQTGFMRAMKISARVYEQTGNWNVNGCVWGGSTSLADAQEQIETLFQMWFVNLDDPPANLNRCQMNEDLPGNY